MVSGTRLPAVAGSFYPAESESLRSIIAQFLKKTKKIITGKKMRALIVPHAGYIYSGQTAVWGFRQLPRSNESPHFVLIGPSHFFGFSGLAASPDRQWSTPLGSITQQPPDKLIQEIRLLKQPFIPEHSLEVQLPFLQMLFPSFSFTALLTGQSVNYSPVTDYLINHYRSSVIIVSSDLSHYLFETQAKKIDHETIDAIINLDKNYFVANDNAACGSQGIVILLTIAQQLNWQRQLVYYDTSATASGDRSQVVGYASIAFYE